ncbi:hypothetical protein Ciccas_009216 [Cichlidogyrus casuarinus]|uniref:Large ribosomal subunit protein bL17m n=1 Tax=Cichlidogyrus casuarinus TaxID=1844966 RepID=A0ABD2PYQ4_9PLAT
MILDTNRDNSSRNLSLAIFAPGWCFEHIASPAGEKLPFSEVATRNNKVFEANDRFWSQEIEPRIYKLRGDMCPVSFPLYNSDFHHFNHVLVTNFCRGMGIYSENAMWSNHKKEQISPTCHQLSEGERCFKVLTSLDLCCGIQSGSCLVIERNSCSTSSDALSIELFHFSFLRLSSKASLSFTFSYQPCNLNVFEAVVNGLIKLVFHVSVTNENSHIIADAPIINLDFLEPSSITDEMDNVKASMCKEISPWYRVDYPNLGEQLLLFSSGEEYSQLAKRFFGTNFGAAAKRIQFPYPRKTTKLPAGDGPMGSTEARLSQMRRCVRALIEHERIELPWPVATSARLYSERLIQEVVLAEARDGPLHEQLTKSITSDVFELIKFWLGDQKLTEKLLLVLLPRYQFSNTAYTDLHKLKMPSNYEPDLEFRSNNFVTYGVLELRGNPWPPIGRPGLPTLVERPDLNETRFTGTVTLSRRIRRSSSIARLFDELKAYDPKIVEDPRYCAELWNRMRVSQSGAKEPIRFLLPPPNLLRSNGSAISYRMNGHKVSWIPGLDHAGIATQSVVEKNLPKGVTRQALGREEFVKRVWDWKHSKEATIKNQLNRLGLSLDWSQEYFTLSGELTKVVNHAFVRLWNEGLIYRERAVVSWCPKLQSVISDIEVETLLLDKTTQLSIPGYAKPIEFGLVDEFAYKIKASDREIVVATTRLETMLGDTAICVHPADERYSSYIGQFVEHPFYVERTIPIIADAELVDPQKGTGAVKISPAHSLPDHLLAKRHQLSAINVFDNSANISLEGPFKGLPRYEAREAIRSKLTELGLMRKRYPQPIQLPICTRSGDIIEPLLLDQCFVRTRQLATDALKAIESGALKLLPAHHESAWREWLSVDSHRDWCISRQLWWGHRIPNYRVNSSQLPTEWIAAESKEMALRSFQLKYNLPNLTLGQLMQDEDVLDTWFSSALLPLSSSGWPQSSTFQPHTLLETGSDILFFWAARMVMMSYALERKLPFEYVLLHGMIRDKKGKKMSKSLGNVVDPLQLVENEALGADALRFGLLSLPIEMQTVPFQLDLIKDARKFCNKIWQTVKFLKFQAGESQIEDRMKDITEFHLIDRWILGKLSDILELQKTTFRFTPDKDTFSTCRAASQLKQFWTEDLCSVYLEVVKRRDSAQNMHVLNFCVLTALQLLHPYMPHITEVIWQNLHRDSCLSLTAYPDSLKTKFSTLNCPGELDQVTEALALGRFINHWRLLLRIPKIDSRYPIKLLAMDASVDQKEIVLALTSIEGFCESHLTDHVMLELRHGTGILIEKNLCDFEAARSNLESRISSKSKKLHSLEKMEKIKSVLVKIDQEKRTLSQLRVDLETIQSIS